MNELSSAARKGFRDSLKPIYKETINGDPELIGTAILLKLKKGYFLLTAAHVLDWNASSTLYLGNSSTNSFLPLKFTAIITQPPENDRLEDHIDFAISPLNAEFVSVLSDVKFITESDISKTVENPEGRFYTCLGYPCSKNKVSHYTGYQVTPRLGTYTSVGKSSKILKNIATDENHIVMSYNAKYSKDDSGKRISTLALNGFSGGAIIDCGRISIDAINSVIKPKIAALFIEAYSNKKVILGTRIQTILNALRDEYDSDASN